MAKRIKNLVTVNTILLVVLLYPITSFFPNLFGQPAFFLTTPYFFLLMAFLVFIILLNGKFSTLNNIKLITFMLGVAIYNFTTFRYSLPIFFILYILVLNIALNSLPRWAINKRMFQSIFYIYIVISIPFIFLAQGWDENGRFLGFIGSPTIYAGIMTIGYALVAKQWKLKTYKFVVLTLIVFCFVILSKTRLLLIFIGIFPLLKYLLSRNLWLNKKRVFLIFLITAISVYPLYDRMTDLFPYLVTIRYDEGSKDKSLGLRLYLNNVVYEDYKSGTVTQKLLGKGNEHSRNLVQNIFKFDIMPHNDFWRLLNDWGLLGLILFLVFLYRMSTVNKNVLYVSLIYILLFYSNMVFNTFIISILIIFYHEGEELTTRNEY